MNLKQALKRIEELEARVKTLEAQPPMMIPYPVAVPAFPQQPCWPPVYPTVPGILPPWLPPIVTCGVPQTGNWL